jgi:hypothetical protein
MEPQPPSDVLIIANGATVEVREGEKENWFQFYQQGSKGGGEIFKKCGNYGDSAVPPLLMPIPPGTTSEPYEFNQEEWEDVEDKEEEIRPMEDLDHSLTSLRGHPSFPDGRSIIVPRDQLFKLVKCHACDTVDKTETRFEGIYTCVACQWKGLAPSKNADSLAEFNAPIQVEEQAEGKKSRGGGDVFITPEVAATKGPNEFPNVLPKGWPGTSSE